MGKELLKVNVDFQQQLICMIARPDPINYPNRWMKCILN